MEKLEWWIYPLFSLALSFCVFVGGESYTCYYPFLLSHKFYITIKNPKLQKILISNQLNRSKSTQTRLVDRNKMAVLGIIHYVIQIPIYAALYVMSLWLIVSKVIGLASGMSSFGGIFIKLYSISLFVWLLLFIAYDIIDYGLGKLINGH